MEKEKTTWRLDAIYKGKDGYGYGTTQIKKVQKEFGELSELREWISENSSVEEFSGFNVATRLHLSSYKTYKIECIECYEDEKFYISHAKNREFKVGDEVLCAISDVRITSPLRGIIKSISCGLYMDVEFDGYGVQTFDVYSPNVYKE